MNKCDTWAVPNLITVSFIDAEVCLIALKSSTDWAMIEMEVSQSFSILVSILYRYKKKHNILCRCRSVQLPAASLPVVEAGADDGAAAALVRDADDLGEVGGLDHDLHVAVVLVHVDREEELVLAGLGHRALVLLGRAPGLAQAALLAVGLSKQMKDEDRM